MDQDLIETNLGLKSFPNIMQAYSNRIYYLLNKYRKNDAILQLACLSITCPIPWQVVNQFVYMLSYLLLYELIVIKV